MRASEVSKSNQAQRAKAKPGHSETNQAKPRNAKRSKGNQASKAKQTKAKQATKPSKQSTSLKSSSPARASKLDIR